MSYRISILDKSPLAAGETAAQALARTLTLAQHAEAWGYHRFWVAEHHNTDQLASPSPELVIAWLLGHTRRIRLGSGGVMLQHYSPYKVAENFNLLAALAPGRIDLGVGKAPGGLPLSTRALQQGLHQEEKGTFADQLAQLDNWLSLTEPGGEESLRATPIPPRRADGFLLGASLESAELAARLDWNFVFAAHLKATARCAVPCSTAGASSARVRRWSPSRWWSLTIRPPPPRWRSRSRCGASSWRTASG